MSENNNANPLAEPTSTDDTLPHVIGVQVGSDHKFSKASRGFIRLIKNHGVEGDAHAGASDQHLFHIKRFGQHPNLRQVHLIQAEFFDDLAGYGHSVSPGDLGENIATRNIDLLAMPTGTKLSVGGEAVVELTGLRNPCHQINGFQSGLLEHCKEIAADGSVMRKAGVMAIVLQGGIVRPGDEISIKLPPRPHKGLKYRTPITD